MPRPWALACAMLVAAAHRTPAQLSVRADRDLDFGTVTAGVAKTVQASDAGRSGQWTVTANLGNQLKLELTLPTSLRDIASTATMSISWPSGYGFLQETGGTPDGFGSNGKLTHRFSVSSTGLVRLGGQVSPTAGQALGTYQSTVILTVTLLN